MEYLWGLKLKVFWDYFKLPSFTKILGRKNSFHLAGKQKRLFLPPEKQRMTFVMLRLSKQSSLAQLVRASDC